MFFFQEFSQKNINKLFVYILLNFVFVFCFFELQDKMRGRRSGSNSFSPSFPHRRGSNVSLVLDMSALGSVEPLSVGVVTPREAAAREYLLSAGRPMRRHELRDVVNNTQRLHAEFAVGPEPDHPKPPDQGPHV